MDEDLLSGLAVLVAVGAHQLEVRPAPLGLGRPDVDAASFVVTIYSNYSIAPWLECAKRIARLRGRSLYTLAHRYARALQVAWCSWADGVMRAQSVGGLGCLGHCFLLGSVEIRPQVRLLSYNICRWT